MIKDIKKNYTKKQLLLAKEYPNIYDVFDDLISKIELFSYLKDENNPTLNYGVFLYVEDLKDHVKGLEFQLKREILEGTLKV